MALDLMCHPESFLKFGGQYLNRQLWRQEGPQGSSDLMDNLMWILSPKGPKYTSI